MNAPTKPRPSWAARLGGGSVGLLLLLSFVWAGPVTADPPGPGAARPDTAALARRAWAVTDLVLARHLDPPTRPEMLADAVAAVLEKAGVRPPDDLSDRLERVTDADQFAAVLCDVWPVKGAAEGLPGVLLQELLPWQPDVGGGELRTRDRWLSPTDLTVQEQLTQNRYVGTGIQVRDNSQANYPMIVVPYAGGPARRAGARAGDLVLEVDGVSMEGKKVGDLVAAVRGPEGTDVTLVVRQPDAEKARTLRMTRSVVPFETAVGYRRVGEREWDYRPDPALPIAYVRLTTVNVSTLRDLRRVEQRLQADGNKALVLDLRQCVPGGELAHFVLVADGLLDGGVLWRVRVPRGKVTEQRADRDCLFRDWPLAVLTNGSIAGTGPVALVAALQDGRRAAVVGEPTARAGYIRSLVPLPDGKDALVLTTGVLERASAPQEPAAGGSRLWDVRPDLPVAPSGEQRNAVFEWQRAQESPDAPGTGARPPEDAVLARAIDWLRASINDPGQPASPRQAGGRSP
jgi:C-terminal peptidase prc